MHSTTYLHYKHEQSIDYVMHQAPTDCRVNVIGNFSEQFHCVSRMFVWDLKGCNNSGVFGRIDRKKSKTWWHGRLAHLETHCRDNRDLPLLLTTTEKNLGIYGFCSVVGCVKCTFRSMSVGFYQAKIRRTNQICCTCNIWASSKTRIHTDFPPVWQKYATYSG